MCRQWESVRISVRTPGPGLRHGRAGHCQPKAAFSGGIYVDAGMEMKKRFGKLSVISAIHYAKLVLRSLLFFAAAVIYISARAAGTPLSFGSYEDSSWLWMLVTFIFAAEMLLRFFPSKYESLGCQKQFAQNYEPLGSFQRSRLLRDSKRQTWPVLLSWLALNGFIFLLYFRGIIDQGILVLIALAYSVCDMICILFYCPFQSLMMKNRCCASCRIYNWDYAMMFTPLIFIHNICARILLILSLLLLLRWELSFYLHPERFGERTNARLSCANCPEKLCQHKRQLHRLHRSLKLKTAPEQKNIQAP